tara:strand:+ start:2695 stop:3459 length:765 start_codon:yes stop_codon:yes gene_type:complete
MPGGYGTSGPWGSAGTTSPRGSYSSPGGGNVRQGSNQAAKDINQAKYEKSPEYLNDPENFQTDGQFNPYLQAATSLQAAGAVTSGALGGQALWTKAPRLPDGSIDYAKQNLIDKYNDVYYSSFALNPDGPNPDAWSPTGLIAISKDPETGKVHHHVVGGSSSHQNNNDGSVSGYSYGYGYGGGSSGVGGYGTGVHPRSFYKGLPYQDFSGKEVQKMLAMNQKVDAANILSGLSQGAQAFAMDPKARGIMSVLTA